MKKNQREKKPFYETKAGIFTFSGIALVLIGIIAAELLMLPKKQSIPEVPEALSVQEAEVPEVEPAESTVPAIEVVDEAVPEEAPAEPAPEEPAEEPEEQEAEPQETVYTISFAGDCTLGDEYGTYGSSLGFVKTVGTNYSWPFENVKEYFENDDLTFVNLECVLGMEGSPADKLFRFHAPAEIVNCLTEGSIEVVTLANNHTMDFGTKGYEGTQKALDGAGIKYAGDNQTLVYETESGLKIGIYAGAWPSASQLENAMYELNQTDAELIICAFHWGEEGSYRADSNQTYLAHKAIDLGADIVYGSHAHVLQPIEEYGDGVIYYSMGNFSFGGNLNPRDYNTAIVQQKVIRNADGTVTLGETIRIPCSISSTTGKNDFKPTPYEEDSDAYKLTLSKLDGTFTGPNLTVSYNEDDETGGTTDQPDDTGTTDSGTTDSGTTGSDTTGSDTTGSDTTGSGTTDSGTTDSGTTDSGTTGGQTDGGTGSDSATSGGDQTGDTGETPVG